MYFNYESVLVALSFKTHCPTNTYDYYCYYQAVM